MDERRALRRRVRRATLRGVAAANVVGALVVTVYIVVVPPGDKPDDVRVAEAIALVVLYVAVTLPLADWLNRRRARDAEQALFEGRRLTPDQRAALIGVPLRASLLTLAGWTGGAILFTVYFALRYDNPADDVAWLGLTVVLGGLTTAALAFLINEAPMRAVYAVAFGTDPPARAEGLGVALRLVLSWVLGAGVPLLGIALAFVGAPQSAYAGVRRGILVLVAVGLLAGLAIVLRAARSVAGPLEGLRRAIAEVQRGNLDAEVTVDDVTEIGQLQAGFNEMVAGLRERARLEDLFGRHVGTDVAREALTKGVALGGEQREVSALFVDIARSTELAAKRAPEEVVTILNAVFQAVVDTATREGGWVNKFEGDAALCVFGAPVEQPDHAARALRTARALRQELSELAGRHDGLDAGIGVSSGVVVAGNVGAEERYEYTVIGDPVNEAARLTEEAKSHPARVLASGRAVAGADGEATLWREAATLQLRGRSEPTVAWQPLRLPDP